MTLLVSAGTTLGLAGAPATRAETPDGETPAEESVCDSLAGDPAWSLCNAYCEAMDCDSDDPRASDRACQHVLERFIAHDSGPIPCGLPPCPCYDEADLDEFVEACESLGGPLECFRYDLGALMLCLGGPGPGGGASTIAGAFPVFSSCFLEDPGGDPTIAFDNLTPDEYQTCVGLIEAKHSDEVCDFGP
jgi:hypothetical protein